MSQAEAPETRDALAALRIDRSRPRQSSWARRLGGTLLWLAVLLVVGGGGALLAERGGLVSWSQLLTPAVEVKVARVEVQTGRSADALVVATGYLESRRQAQIGAKATGRIESIVAEEGTRVEKGETIAVLEHADLDASLAAAEATVQRARAQCQEQRANLEQEERDFERAQALHRTRGFSKEELEQAELELKLSQARLDALKAAVALAEARVNEARQQRENMFIRAPFTGTIISKNAEVGESLMPGGLGEGSGRGAVVTIADLDHLEVDTDVKEDYISRVRLGQSAEVAVDAVPDRRYQGRVRIIIPMGDRARATIKVKVAILNADDRLFPEMSSTVYFLPEPSAEAAATGETAQRKVLCPAAAVRGEPAATFVWQIDDQDCVRRVPVQVGPRQEQKLEITRGLTGGERVVLDPPPQLQDGQRVKVAP